MTANATIAPDVPENVMAANSSLTHLSYRSCVDAIEDVLGPNGKNSVLRFAGLGMLIENPIDYDNDARVPYGYVTKLFLGVRDLLGDKGYDAVMYRGGLFSVRNIVKHSEPLRNLIVMEYDPVEKLKLGYQAYVKNGGFDLEKTLEYVPDQHQILVHRPDCSECEALVKKNQRARACGKPSCSFIRGLLKGIGDCFEKELSVTVEEDKCRLIGSDECRYRITYTLK